MHVNPCPSGRPSSRPPERKVRLYPSVQSPSSRVDYMWKRNNAQMELAGLPGGPARPIAGRDLTARYSTWSRPVRDARAA